MFGKYRLHIISSLTGAVVGYFVIHPYTMAASYIMNIHSGAEIHWNWHNVFEIVLANFKPPMIPMTVAFTLFGSVIGLLIGMILKRKKYLHNIAHENEKKQVAIETLQRLMITLSHYLLNANVVIGGEVRHSRKTATNEDSLASLKVIEQEAKKIDSVVRALRKITTIRTANYTSEGHDLMIDITEEIEEQLHKLGSPASKNNKTE